MELHCNNTDIAEDATYKIMCELEPYRQRLCEIKKRGLYDAPESSINAPDDDVLLKEVRAVARSVRTPELAYVLVIGIGGSNLGTKAVHDALRGVLCTEKSPEVIFSDTIDSERMAALTEFLRTKISTAREVVVVIASKSGTTTETIMNTEILLDAFARGVGEDIRSRCIVISDIESELSERAAALGMRRLTIPAPIGGRYSVFTSVGLAPLLLAGFDIDALRAGAVSMREAGLEENGANPAMISAAVQYAHIREGRDIHNLFAFHPELESLGKWWRQLVGESLGKRNTVEGKEVHAGMTPLVSIGSLDLHSVGQLYIGGPQDKLTTFLWSKTESTPVPMPSERMFPDILPYLSGKCAEEVMTAILEGVKASYRSNSLPFMENVLDDISEFSLGAFMQFKMMEIMYLAKLLNVNAFDQPEVESYKAKTRRLLKQ